MVARRIEKLILSGPTVSCPDKDMKEVSYYAVRRKRWALHLVGSNAGSGKTDKNILDVRANVEQNYRIMFGNKSKGEKVSSALETATCSKASAVVYSLPLAVAWFQGQGKYGRDPRAPRRKELPYSGDRRCYNSGSSDHILSKSTKERDNDQIMKFCIKYFIKNKTAADEVSIFKRLITDQSAHVNFLSEELRSNLSDHIDTCKTGRQYVNDNEALLLEG